MYFRWKPLKILLLQNCALMERYYWWLPSKWLHTLYYIHFILSPDPGGRGTCSWFCTGNLLCVEGVIVVLIIIAWFLRGKVLSRSFSVYVLSTCTVDLSQVDSHIFFSGCFKISLHVFKIMSTESTWNKNKLRAEGAREPWSDWVQQGSERRVDLYHLQEIASKYKP